jgi:putative restriction endonuclease
MYWSSVRMTMSTPQEVLQAFERIRVFQRGDQRAIHKPLLILLALARLSRGESRLAAFTDVDKPLKQLLAEFAPTNADKNRHYPFWHLSSDGIWELSGPSSLLSRPAGATPNLSELRDPLVAGGFTPAVDQALRRDPSLLRQLAQQLLDEHFPETLHADILDAVGLDLHAPLIAAEPTVDTVRRKRRDPMFRDRVLRAYEHRCCVCGFDLRIGHITAGIEAAHIKWFQYQGPDTESNGLALCALHHKVFDLGGFTIEPDNFSLVFSEHAIMGEKAKHLLLGYHGAGMIMPQRAEYRPRAEFLRWHETQVFKRPGRSL